MGVRISVLAVTIASCCTLTSATANCYEVLPADVRRYFLHGRSLDVIRLLEPQLAARRTSFDSIVWAADDVVADSQYVACSLRAVHTAYHNLGLHEEGQAIGNATLEWLWRVYGPADVREHVSSVRLRDLSSASALAAASTPLQADVWPPESQLAVHVIAHLLRDYIGHSNRARVRARDRLDRLSRLLSPVSPAYASLLRFARDCTLTVDSRPHPSKHLIAKMRVTRGELPAKQFAARQAITMSMLGMEVHKAGVMVGLPPTSPIIVATAKMRRLGNAATAVSACPADASCVPRLNALAANMPSTDDRSFAAFLLEQSAADAAAVQDAGFLTPAPSTPEPTPAEARYAAPTHLTPQEAGWADLQATVEADGLHPIAGQLREEEGVAFGQYPLSAPPTVGAGRPPASPPQREHTPPPSVPTSIPPVQSGLPVGVYLLGGGLVVMGSLTWLMLRKPQPEQKPKRRQGRKKGAKKSTPKPQVEAEEAPLPPAPPATSTTSTGSGQSRSARRRRRRRDSVSSHHSGAPSGSGGVGAGSEAPSTPNFSSRGGLPVPDVPAVAEASGAAAVREISPPPVVEEEAAGEGGDWATVGQGGRHGAAGEDDAAGGTPTPPLPPTPPPPPKETSDVDDAGGVAESKGAPPEDFIRTPTGPSGHVSPVHPSPPVVHEQEGGKAPAKLSPTAAPAPAAASAPQLPRPVPEVSRPVPPPVVQTHPAVNSNSSAVAALLAGAAERAAARGSGVDPSSAHSPHPVAGRRPLAWVNSGLLPDPPNKAVLPDPTPATLTPRQPPATPVALPPPASPAQGMPMPPTLDPSAPPPVGHMQVHMGCVFALRDGPMGFGYYNLGAADNPMLQNALAQQHLMQQHAAALARKAAAGGQGAGVNFAPPHLNLPGAFDGVGPEAVGTPTRGGGTPRAGAGSFPRSALSPTGPINIPLPGHRHTLNIGTAPTQHSAAGAALAAAAAAAAAQARPGHLQPLNRIPSAHSMSAGSHASVGELEEESLEAADALRRLSMVSHSGSGEGSSGDRTLRGSSVASDLSRRSSTGSRGGAGAGRLANKGQGLLPSPAAAPVPHPRGGRRSAGTRIVSPRSGGLLPHPEVPVLVTAPAPAPPPAPAPAQHYSGAQAGVGRGRKSRRGRKR